MEYPRMVYLYPAASGAPVALNDGKYDTKIVLTDAELADAKSAGWCIHPTAARQAYDEAQQAAAAAADAAWKAKQLAEAEALVAESTAPPTRAEMEQKATELGVKFDGRTSDKALGDRIAAALEA